MKLYLIQDTEARDIRFYLSSEKPPPDSTQVVRAELEVKVLKADDIDVYGILTSMEYVEWC